MNSFIITYDIAKIGDYNGVYNALIDRIKTYEIWAHINDSCWAVKAEATAVNVRDFLLAVMRQGDRLCVVQSAHIAAWHNLLCTNDWLQENI